MTSDSIRLRSHGTEAAVARIVVFFVLLFAMWTLAYHAATFGRVSWKTLCTAVALAGVPFAFFAAWASQRFALAYAKEVEESPLSPGLQGTLPLLGFIAATALLLAVPMYDLRLIIAVFSVVTMLWLTRGRHQRHKTSIESTSIDAAFFARYAAWILVVCAGIAALMTLVVHRPASDDSSFIQIAAQTLRFPERAPLTFDASLGTVIEPFRFAPYRLASYEMLVAFLVEWTGLDLLTVYFLLLPGLAAALTIGVAFLFARWFLSRGLAVVAVVVFLLIVLAWGEAHRAYGNFVFVRLSEGKALLIAITTPVTVIAGLMLGRRPSVWGWTFLALAHVVAIGVSSSGLVCVFGSTALIVIATARRNMRAFAVSAALIASTLFYPAVLGAWLKFAATGSVHLSELGTFAPINTSLGLNVREALALAMLVLGVGALGASVQRHEYAFLVCALLLVVLNPWLSELLSKLSARNVSWRLAWAAPTPLLLAVAVAATVAPALGPRTGRWLILHRGTLAGTAALLIFLGAARWTLSKANNVNWRWPSPKLPAIYASAQEIAAVLKPRASQGAVLADRAVAMWLPLLAPDVSLVMPGHTYPKMLRTVLPPSEFADRMLLFSAINGQEVDASDVVELTHRYRVATLVLQQGSNAERTIIKTVQNRTDIQTQEIGIVGQYRIVALTPNKPYP